VILLRAAGAMVPGPVVASILEYVAALTPQGPQLREE